MCGVETVVIIFGGGTTTVVETGITSVGGDSVVDAAAGIEDGSVGGASREGDNEEQAVRIRARRRSERISFAIST
jgi:hypothetical protein